MKLLNDQRIEREDGELKLTIKPVTTSQQARLLELGWLSGPEARINLTRYCLKNLVDEISISGEKCDPAKLADHADLRDSDTWLVMLKIGQVVFDASAATDEQLKKP